MQVQLVITGATHKQYEAVLRSLKSLEGDTETPTTTTAPAKRGRKPKETEEQFNLSNDDGPGERGANGDRSLDEMDADEQAETEAEVTETAEDEQPELSLSDVVRAFKDFAKTNGREKALKILTKYKVKSVQDLKKSQYAQVLETLEG